MKQSVNFFWQFPQIALVVLLLFYTINTTPAQTTLPAEDIAEKALAATVYLEMKDANGKTLGIGSGFFVKFNIIATNYHVIEGAAEGTAKLVGKNTKYNIEGVTATDKANDLALLKVRTFRTKPLSLGDSDKVRIGETVYVAGNPKGLEGTFSDGIISSRRDKDTKERLQMTAPISPGSSGGPVLNKKGEVIGVSVAVHRALDAQNLNFAIPSAYLKKLLIHSRTITTLGQGNVFISAETYFKWGNAKFELKNFKGAIANYTKAIKLKPKAANIYYNRGLARGQSGQHLAAILDFSTTIDIKPDFAEAYFSRGVVYVDWRQYKAALSDFDMAIQLKPDFAETYYRRGLVMASFGQHLAAIQDFNTAIRLKPDFAEVYHIRGVVMTDLGEHFSAISDFDMAIRLKPAYTDAYYNRGIAKSGLEQYAAAIEDYDVAIRLKPDYVDVYRRRGGAKAILDQYFAAIKDFDIVIQLLPRDAKAYYARGLVKTDLEQHFAAIKDFDIAIQLQTDFAEAYYTRGISKIVVGRRLGAKRDLQSAWLLATDARDIRLKSSVEKALRILNE